ncbi:MAG: TraG/TraD/VirD4 family protein, partial [Eisenbergiella sp.]
MDEFYAGARPYAVDSLMGVVRSRNISLIPILQSVAQLKALYPGDKWQILMDNCAVLMYLGSGSGALETHKYISELIGKMTIDTANDGRSGKSGSVNYGRAGREL